MRIRVNPLDRLFSQYIRLRDGGICQRCGGRGNQTSHFHGRRKKSVRWNEDNAIFTCFGCHHFFHANPLEHVEWFKQRLGPEVFELLNIQANTPQKVDEWAVTLYLKSMLEELKR